MLIINFRKNTKAVLVKETIEQPTKEQRGYFYQ